MLAATGWAQPLEPGDLVIADRQGMGPARLLQVERATGRQHTLYVSYDGVLVAPRDLEIDAQGRIVASQSATPLRPAPEGIVRFDPVNGAATRLSEGGQLLAVDGIAVARTGAIYAADHGDATGTPPSIVRVDATTGAQSAVTSGGLLVRPVDVAVEPGGSLVVLDAGTGSGARLVRVDPASGAQTLLVGAGPLGPAAGGVDVDVDGSIVVLDAFGGLFRVAPATGAVTPLAVDVGVTSTDLALEPDGDALVLAGSGADRIDRVDLATGALRTLASGLVSPVGVAVVRPTAPFCDAEVEEPRYTNGQTLRVSTLRLVNPLAAAFATRVRLRVAIPGNPTPVPLLDVPVTLPPRIDADLAPFALLTVSAGLPRGDWELRCAFEDAETGTVRASDVARFTLE